MPRQGAHQSARYHSVCGIRRPSACTRPFTAHALQHRMHAPLVCSSGPSQQDPRLNIRAEERPDSSASSCGFVGKDIGGRSRLRSDGCHFGAVWRPAMAANSLEFGTIPAITGCETGVIAPRRGRWVVVSGSGTPIAEPVLLRAMRRAGYRRATFRRPCAA